MARMSLPRRSQHNDTKLRSVLATRPSFYLKAPEFHYDRVSRAPRTQPQGDRNTGGPGGASAATPSLPPRGSLSTDLDEKHFQNYREKKSNNEEHEEASEVYRIMEESMANNINLLPRKKPNLNMVKHKWKRDVP